MNIRIELLTRAHILCTIAFSVQSENVQYTLWMGTNGNFCMTKRIVSGR